MPSKIICPLCAYDSTKKSHGKFFKIPVQTEKKKKSGTVIKDLYGCPKCNIVFMHEGK